MAEHNKNKIQNSTEAMYDKLLIYAEHAHEVNRRRIKNGLISLAVIPILLIIIRYVTDSSRISFLIMWIFLMFIVAALLIYVSYFDYQLQNMLQELSDQEMQEFDNLLAIRRSQARTSGKDGKTEDDK